MNDSGNRKKFKSGAVREPLPGRGRFDLISPFALVRLAKVNEKGAVKYADRNWEKGMPYSEFIDRALRHIVQYMMGENDEDHLAHAMWNLHALIHMEETCPELDDMPRYLERPKK